MGLMDKMQEMQDRAVESKAKLDAMRAAAASVSAGARAEAPDTSAPTAAPTWGAAEASAAKVVVFKAIQLGIRPEVRVSAQALTYEKRYANWLTWTLILLSGGAAAFAWPWVLFGRRSLTLPASSIQSVQVHHGTSWATLQAATVSGLIRFRTDVATAERARDLLLEGAQAGAWVRAQMAA